MFKKLIQKVFKKQNGKWRKSVISLLSVILCFFISEVLGVDIGQDKCFQLLSNLLNP